MEPNRSGTTTRTPGTGVCQRHRASAKTAIRRINVTYSRGFCTNCGRAAAGLDGGWPLRKMQVAAKPTLYTGHLPFDERI